jgi:hypothetical protein
MIFKKNSSSIVTSVTCCLTKVVTDLNHLEFYVWTHLNTLVLTTERHFALASTDSPQLPRHLSADTAVHDETWFSGSHGRHFDPYYGCTLSDITHNKNVFQTRVDVGIDFFLLSLCGTWDQSLASPFRYVDIYQLPGQESGNSVTYVTVNLLSTCIT